VPAGCTDHRPDENALIRDGGNLGEDLADFDSVDRSLDRLEFAADFGRGVYLHIPHVLMGRPARKEDIDDRLVALADSCLGLRRQELRQRQAPHHHPTNFQKVAAALPIAKAARRVLGAVDGKHGGTPRGGNWQES